jgi:hypothetical protein
MFAIPRNSPGTLTVPGRCAHPSIGEGSAIHTDLTGMIIDNFQVKLPLCRRCLFPVPARFRFPPAAVPARKIIFLRTHCFFP